MIAVGYQGPMLLEDAVDLAGMMVALNRAVPPHQWVEEWRARAEMDAMTAAFGF